LPAITVRTVRSTLKHIKTRRQPRHPAATNRVGAGIGFRFHGVTVFPPARRTVSSALARVASTSWISRELGRLVSVSDLNSFGGKKEGRRIAAAIALRVQAQNPANYFCSFSAP